ncbi:hypothetical protein KR084_011004 [Drosophila pseudotakahashii]|nr:hypothetical protein KR084_011004 [Drosophila pseudotakahashii]
MSMKCRICGSLVEYGRKLFDIDGVGHLQNILSLTGVWVSLPTCMWNALVIMVHVRFQLINKPGVPSTMCLSCLLDLNAAVAFRQRLIRTNHSWLEAQIDLSNKKDREPGNILNEEIQSDEEQLEDNEEDIVEDEEIFEDEEIQEDVEELLQDEEELEDNEEAIVEDEETKENGEEVQQDEDDFEEEVLEDDEWSLDDDDLNINNVKMYDSSTLQSLVSEVPKAEYPERQSNEKMKNSTSSSKRKRKKSATIYVCDHCGKQMNDKGNLDTHVLRHTGVRPFECPECDHREINRYTLNIHIRVKHRGEKPYACKYCDEKFETSIKRTRHTR